MNIPSNSEPNSEPQRRTWSASRIISALVLLILILFGIGFATYQLTGNGPKGKTTSTTYGSNHLVSPTQGNNGQSGSSNQSTHPTTNNTTGGTKSSPSSTNTNQSGAKQLSNTGPGDTALIGFSIAAIVGTSIHYRWRRIRGTNA